MSPRLAIPQLVLCLLGNLAAARPLQTARELADVNRGRPCSETNFALTATLARPMQPIGNSILVLDDTGATSLILDSRLSQTPLAAGDLIDIRGDISYSSDGRARVTAREMKVLGHGTPPPILDTDIAGIMSGDYDFRLVRITATVQDAFVDEIDPRFFFLVLQQGGETIYAAAPRAAMRSDRQEELVGAVVTVTGDCDAYRQRIRRLMGRSVAMGSDCDIVVIRPASSNAYDVPDISSLRDVTPDEMHARGRHKTRGRVLVAWHGDTFLLKTDDKDIVRIETATKDLPNAGDEVEAVGFPETDVYNINLIRAKWRRLSPSAAPRAPDGPIPLVSARQLLSDERNWAKMNAERHGQLLRMEGLVRALPGIGNDNILYLESDRTLIAVDLSANPCAADGLEVGSRISVTGICVMKVDRFRPNAALPRVRGFTLVLRETDGITVLSKPSMWTPAVVWSVFGVMLAILCAAFGWNISLRRLAERRGRQLMRDEIATVKAKLQVEERTRLAAELHDTLAQNMTGISMEIEAANDLRGNAPKPMLDHLGIAAKALKSCRDELRNCLWDLRSQALEEQDMTTAILRTLQPHVNESNLAVRFNIPRTQLSDKTAHALLRIIRELVLNATRHGEATSVEVNGTIDNDKLRCCVADNGKGFDPQTAPGVLQGHFGIQGIHERIDELGGTFEITSTIGKGTRATITIPIPHKV